MVHADELVSSPPTHRGIVLIIELQSVSETGFFLLEDLTAGVKFSIYKTH